MPYEEIKNDIRKLSEGKFQIVAAAKREGRELTRKEDAILSEMDGALLAMSKTLPDKPLSGPGSDLNGFGNSTRHDGGLNLIGPNERKDYKALFGNAGTSWKDKNINFFSAVLGGRAHSGLIRNSLNETVPSDGGFLVPGETAARIHAVSLENELVMPRAYLQPMMGNSIKIPAMSIGDHSTALFGGFTASYTDEAGTISEANPKARAMELNARKLTGLIRFSAELNSDVPGGMSQIETLCGKGLAWYRDKSFLKGVGSSEPLGILNSNCLISVSPETGQAADTIVYENLISCMSRMFAGSFANSTWVCHQSTIPQLLQLSIVSGLSGSHVPVMSESNGQFTILTRPVVFTEKMNPLGDKGDIMLADFSQYVVGLREGMRFDSSIHVAFETDEILSRIIERHDGQPLWDSSLVLEDGSTTVSPFVTLAART